MPQNEDEDAGERQQQPEREAEVLGQQRIGIGADRVEGDIAEVEQAGEADHDIEPPAEHHVDQNLDAEIVDPFQRAAEAGGANDDRRVDDDEADGERHEPFADDTRASAAAQCATGAQRALLEPRLGHQRISQPAAADEGDDGEQQRPARGQDKIVAEVDDRLEADQRQEQAEGDERGEAGVAQRAGHFDALSWRAGGHAQTFSTSGRPNRPCGRKIRVIASTEKAATSL